MDVDRRNFLLLGSSGLVALGTAQVALAELPALLHDEGFAPAPASKVFARAFNRWMDDAVRQDEQCSHEADEVALFRQQLRLRAKPSHGAGAAALLLHYLDLEDTRVIALGTTTAGAPTIATAEVVFARAFNLWMYEVVRHPEQWSHEAHDVAAFRKQLALGIEPSYGMRASANLVQFLEQAQVAA
jgi:hypothetical protein